MTRTPTVTGLAAVVALEVVAGAAAAEGGTPVGAALAGCAVLALLGGLALWVRRAVSGR